MNYLLRSIAKDESIDVSCSAANEGMKMSIQSKGLITDIASWLRDGRLTDLEIQKIRQDYIFTRLELYASQMLLIQYSVEVQQAKGELNFGNLKDVLIVVLMVERPAVFKEHDKENDHYIHRHMK